MQLELLRTYFVPGPIARASNALSCINPTTIPQEIGTLVSSISQMGQEGLTNFKELVYCLKSHCSMAEPGFSSKFVWF